MLDIIEITIKEFEETIYDKYITLFPENEQRDWQKINKAYNKGIEKFFKIQVAGQTVGFLILGTLGEKYPYYLDYFGIFKEYQGKGYGTRAIKKLIENIEIERGIWLEIETVMQSQPHTMKRAEFYKKIGFVEKPSEYLIYGVHFTPYIYGKKYIRKEEIDKIMIDYYIANIGINDVKKHCKIIK